LFLRLALCPSGDVSKSFFDPWNPCTGGSVICSYGIIQNLKLTRKGWTAHDVSHRSWSIGRSCSFHILFTGLDKKIRGNQVYPYSYQVFRRFLQTKWTGLGPRIAARLSASDSFCVCEPSSSGYRNMTIEAIIAPTCLYYITTSEATTVVIPIYDFNCTHKYHNERKFALTRIAKSWKLQ